MLSDLLADRLDPSRSVLVVIDVQNDFCHPEGSAARAGRDVARASRVHEQLAPTVGAARRAGVPVVFVRTEHDGEVDSLPWRRRFDARQTEPNPVDNVNCATGTWGAEHYQVEPRSGDAVVTKHRYSAFSNPDFEATLRDLGRPSLLMTGVATDVCVENTIRAAVDGDFLAAIVEDCAASYADADHGGAVARLARSFGPVFRSEHLIEHWRSERLVDRRQR